MFCNIIRANLEHLFPGSFQIYWILVTFKNKALISMLGYIMGLIMQIILKTQMVSNTITFSSIEVD